MVKCVCNNSRPKVYLLLSSVILSVYNIFKSETYIKVLEVML